MCFTSLTLSTDESYESAIIQISAIVPPFDLAFSFQNGNCISLSTLYIYYTGRRDNVCRSVCFKGLKQFDAITDLSFN